MSTAVTAFSVKIATPCESAIESVIAREVIAEWNAHHGWAEKRVLLPVNSSKTCPEVAGDLLISFFGDNQQAPEKSKTGLEEQLSGQKPALVFFSEARANLHGDHLTDGRSLEEFQKKYASATVDSYGDEKEYRAKFAWHLDATVGCHPYFKTDAMFSPQHSRAVSVPTAAPAPAPLSSCAVIILSEACDDFEAYIGRMKTGDSLKIQANGKQLVEQGDAATVARWDGAFQELLQGGFIRDAGCNGQLFQISSKGFDFLKTIGKTPVGYIAEMGGM